jgi:hypothetical protein
MSIFVIPKTYRTVNSRDHSPVLWLTFEEEMWRLHSRHYFLSRPMLYLLQEHILHPMTLFGERMKLWRAAAQMALNTEAVSCCGFLCRYSTSRLIYSCWAPRPRSGRILHRVPSRSLRVADTSTSNNTQAKASQIIQGIPSLRAPDDVKLVLAGTYCM